MRQFAGRTVFLVLLGTVGAGQLAAQLKGFPWINRADPKVNSVVFLSAPQFRLNCKEIGVFPFSIPAHGENRPPEFATFLRQALLMQGRAEAIADIATLPWDEMPAWKVRELTDTRRVAAAAKDGDARRLDLVVLGGVDSLYRKPSDGLVVRVTLRVIDTRTSEVLWYGTKQADWLRHFPLEECLLHVAWLFVEAW